MPGHLVPLGQMRWIVCGIVGACLWGQGQDPLRDSLVVENERIEYLELGLKPYLSPPSFDMPKWEFQSTPQWEKSPSPVTPLPEAMTPGRPVWARLDPLHLRYSVGRFWTQEAQLIWNKTRALPWDAGLRLYHYSNLQPFLPQARAGVTTLTAWGGYYTANLTLEGYYEESYQKYRFYAPFAENWPGYDATAPLPDSLQIAFLRGHGAILLRLPKARTYLRYRTARMYFHSGVPPWLHYMEGGITFRLPFSGEGTMRGEVFTDGTRYSFSARPTYTYQSALLSLNIGLEVSYARDLNRLFLLSPVGEIVYKGLSPLFRPYLKAEAYVRPINYPTQVLYNPYLRRVPGLLPFERTWTVSEVGLRGQGRGWDYRVAAEYALREGVPLFVPEGAAFRVDTLRQLRSLGGVVQVLYMPAPTGAYMELRFTARHWKVRSHAYTALYGGAPIEGSLRSGYRFHEKWHFWAALTLIGPRALDETTRAPAFVDISWRVERRVLPVLTFFVEMNNLLNQRFYRWRGYRERPLDFCLGIWSKIG